MRVWEATIEILKETDNPSVMYGDLNLLHDIANRLGWEQNGFKTTLRVLNALDKTPGPLVKWYSGRMRVFSLPTDERLKRIIKSRKEP